MAQQCAESAPGGYGEPPRLGGDVAGVPAVQRDGKMTSPHDERQRSLSRCPGWSSPPMLEERGLVV